MSALTIPMPVYNTMPYLPAAVESIVAPTFRDFEFVIVDDGSTAASGEYQEQLRDPRIRLNREQRRGLTAMVAAALCPRALLRQMASRPQCGISRPVL